jgi:hypothetical protein|tara:strand:+ start:1250 stop:1795 length:546 start_codon:yes stop_codon:yes gene_type:complete
MNIILYMGGCCGDIVTGLIDAKGISISSGRCIVLNERSKLKRSFQFNNDKERDEYITTANVYWKSLPSHDADYHLRNKHSYTGIVCSDWETAIWAATRFRILHTDIVWNRMSKVSGAKSIEEYAQLIMDFSNMIKPDAYKIIDLKDIVNGHAVSKLKSLTDLDDCATIIYNQWLKDVVNVV